MVRRLGEGWEGPGGGLGEGWMFETVIEACCTNCKSGHPIVKAVQGAVPQWTHSLIGVSAVPTSAPQLVYKNAFQSTGKCI